GKKIRGKKNGRTNVSQASRGIQLVSKHGKTFAQFIVAEILRVATLPVMSAPESNAQLSLEVFHFEEGKPSFEDMSKANGIRYWLASELALLLGYETLESFRKCLN